MLWERIEKLIKKRLDRNRFIWLVDPLGIISSTPQNLLSQSTVYLYDNPIDFRLFYEPLREKLEEDKPVNAIIISRSEEEIPPDVRRYASPLHIKPSFLFPSLHPIIDDILVSRKLVERFAPFFDDIPRRQEETIRFVLGTLMETPISPSPSIRDSFLILLNYHHRSPDVPAHFLHPYLSPLEELGFTPEKLLQRENFLELLRQLLLVWIEKRANISLGEFGIEEKARKLLSSIGLELDNLKEEVWKRIDWSGIAKEIPLSSLPSLISPLLPEEFYSHISERVIEQLKQNKMNEEALKAGKKLREKGKAKEELESLLEIVEFIHTFSLPQQWKGWLELGRKIALQWRNVMRSLRDGSPLRKEWESLLDFANRCFVEFVLTNYPQWLKGKPRPLLSCDVLDEAVLPHIRQGRRVYLLVMDGMTYAQWAVIEDYIKEKLSGHKFEDKGCFSILPSATLFSRNSIFAGALPRNIAEKYGMVYLYDNEREAEMLENWLREKVGRGKRVVYCKSGDWDRTLREEADLKAFVLNFTDEITHLTGKTAVDEEELLALVETICQFRRFSHLLSTVKKEGAVLVITSDHGSIWVERTEQILREDHKEAKRSNRYYQLDRRPERETKEALYLSPDKAVEWGLPQRHYLIAYGYFMFSARQYPHKIAVHGGISLWEMCLPLAIFTP